MKLRNSIRPIRLLLLLSSLLALASCRQNETQSLSEYLDYVIENKHIFEAEKEERISRLRNLLGVSNLTPEQEYEINTKLYEEFRKYKLDSAIRYVERNLEIARQLDNKRLTYLSNMYLAQLYSFRACASRRTRYSAPSDRPNSRAICFLSTTRPTTVISSTMPR